MEWINAAYERGEISVDIYSGQWLDEYQIVTTEPLCTRKIESYPSRVNVPYYFVDLEDIIRAHKRRNVPVLVYSFKTDAVQITDGFRKHVFSIARDAMSQAMRDYLASGGLASMDRYILNNMGIKYEVDGSATMIRLPARQLIVREKIKEESVWEKGKRLIIQRTK